MPEVYGFIHFFPLPKMKQSFLFVPASLSGFLEMGRVPGPSLGNTCGHGTYSECGSSWPQDTLEKRQRRDRVVASLAFAEFTFLRLFGVKHTDMPGKGKRRDPVWGWDHFWALLALRRPKI